MVRYLIILFLFTFIGCEMNGKQIIKPEKFNFDLVKFNTVSKKLIFENSEKSTDAEDMKKIINYWFDNKIKTNGFNGSLNIFVKNINTQKIKKDEYFKFIIEITFVFEEKSDVLSQKKTSTVRVSDYGEINGNFSIKDQENLTINIMHQSLENVTNKLNTQN